MPDIRSSLFGRLASETELVSAEQVEECLQLQAQYEKGGKKVPRLGELMAAKGYLTADQVREILRAQKSKPQPPAARPPDPVRAVAKEQGKAPAPDPGTSERRTGGEVFGQFRILKRLGADAAGYTYKAKYIPKDLPVTLRVLSQEKMKQDPEYVKAFEQQVKKATDLKHQAIQRVVAGGRAHGRDFYAAHYVEGISLKRILEARGKVEIPFAVEIAIQLAEALEYGHAHGLFHQEIRPSNILITPERKALLVGYGVARDAIGNIRKLAKDGTEMPFYIAPEQVIAEGKEGKCDSRTDIYSLGVTLYHALTGEPPFNGNSLEEVVLNLSEEEVADPTLLNPDIPQELANLVLSMMNPEPDKRYQTATHLLSDLRAIAKGFSRPKVGTRTVGAIGTGPHRVLGEQSTARAAPRRGPSADTTHARRAPGRQDQRDARGKPHRRAGQEDQNVITLAAGGVVLVLAVLGILYLVFKGQSQREEQAARQNEMNAAAQGAAEEEARKRLEEQRRQTFEDRETRPSQQDQTSDRWQRRPQPAPQETTQTPPQPQPGPAPQPTDQPTPQRPQPQPAREEEEEPANRPVPTWLRDMHSDNETRQEAPPAGE